MFRWLRRWWHPFRVTVSERRWRRLARSVSRETFLTWLAEQVANDLLNNKPATLPVADLVVAVESCPSDDLQYRAERFLERLYCNYPFYDQKYFALIAAFRAQIKQHLLKPR